MCYHNKGFEDNSAVLISDYFARTTTFTCACVSVRMRWGEFNLTDVCEFLI